MLFGEYDYETDIRVQRQEAFEDGVAEGIDQGAEQKAIETAKNALKNNIPVEMVVKITGLTENMVLELKKEIGE